MEICVFVAGYIVGGLAGMFVMAMAFSASRADSISREKEYEGDIYLPDDKISDSSHEKL